MRVTLFLERFLISQRLFTDRPYFPKKYDGASHQERAELLKAHAKIGDVWGVVSFFLLSSESYLKVLSDYSKHLTKGMQAP